MTDPSSDTSTSPARRRVLLAMVALAVGLPVAACGRRPERLRPPEGAEDRPFPRTYPTS